MLVYRPNGQGFPMLRTLATDFQKAPTPFSEISIRPDTQRPRAVPLPFTVRLVRTHDQLARAVNVRAAAYAKRLPSIACTLGNAEREDDEPGSIVLLAESKETQAPVGTLRIHTNLHGPTEFERELTLPREFEGHSIAHVSRLGVISRRFGGQVKLALFKALYRYCLARQIEWILVTGIPPRDRDYVSLKFTDVFPDGRMVTLPSSMGIPARLLAFNVRTAEQRWREAGHQLYDFMCNQIHDDIRIFDSVSGAWSNNRAKKRNSASTKRISEISFDVPIV